MNVLKRVIIVLGAIFVLALVIIGCGKDPVVVTVVSEATNNEHSDRTETSVLDKREDNNQSNEETITDEGVIRVETPESTCFSEIGYDSNHGLLYVTFRSSGASYVYSEVPNVVWKSLLNAESKGGYYNKEIKGQFPCKKQ